MGNIFDVILLLVPLIIVVTCFAIGFFRLLRPFWKIAAFLLAWSLKGSVIVTGTVGKLINGEGIKRFVNGRVEAVWAEKVKTAAEVDGVSLAERFDGVFGFFGTFVTNVKEFTTGHYGQTVEGDVAEGMKLSEQIEAFVMDVTEYATDAVIGFITSLVGFLCLYVLFMIGFWIVSKMLEGIFGDGLFGTLNRVLGGAVGVVYGFVGAWLLSIVFVLLFPKLFGMSVEGITGGLMGVTEWFYTDFFLSELLGLTL
jgi:hypothetical protein